MGLWMGLYNRIHEISEMITDDRASLHGWQRRELERTRSQWERIVPRSPEHGMPWEFRVRGYEHRYEINGVRFEIDPETNTVVKI